MIAVAILAVMDMIAIPLYIHNARKDDVQAMFRQIVLVESAIVHEHCGLIWNRFLWVNGRQTCEIYYYTDGSFNETAEEALMECARFNFRPDPSVAFHIMPPAAVDGVIPRGFIAFAAHNSLGSPVYVFDSLAADSAWKSTKIKDYETFVYGQINQAREGAVYGGIKFTNSAPLFCYKYDSSNDTFEKSLNAIRLVPDPNDEYPRRMIVAAESE